MGVFLDTQTLKKHPSGHPNIFVKNFLKCESQAYIIEFFHLHIIPMTLYKDIMPYFDKFIHVYGWNRSFLWAPLKIWMPKYFTIAKFGHTVSKFRLRPCAKSCPPPRHFHDFEISAMCWKSPVVPCTYGLRNCNPTLSNMVILPAQKFQSYFFLLLMNHFFIYFFRNKRCFLQITIW